MAEAQWKIVFFLGLICLTESRIIGHLTSKISSQSGLKNSEIIAADRGRHKQGRLSEAEFSAYSLQEPDGPGTYAFGYDNVVDPTGNEQFRSEEKLKNGTIVGEYGYTDYKNKKIVRVTYTADMKGYRARTQVLPLDDIY